ncbi:L-cystine transporter [Salmonella enterica subsp. enterica serovar Typhimurium]|uniref:Cation:dicarboxylase symporter family transporter n=2 Tax=Salmonella enterica TaxID=28901 RepID=A0A753Y869_SALER|nr:MULTISPECIES: L-cystine transporter [Salmonella]EBH2522037.1 L-cystine transporter [Salmonella enterica subsp. enterica serovar Enteritidis]EGX4205685.1 L-cystine transporter [Salmonella enterica subsp. enterica serovar Buckeye]HAR9811612.1 L-cystine transporter [Salmonella enterica subsp. enterica serovar 4,[5],12:i:-]EAA1516487.1 L-cystine transporter [Salmonella enterica subsp. enterica serovar Typhimurium]EAA4842328.1 L-cystine transporter [Salmonella enterica subsp. enterica serovar Ty
MVVTLAYIALFLVFSWVILRINQKSDSLSKSVFIAIFLGAVIGLSLHFISANHTKTIIEWYSIVGNGYVHLLKLVAIPLIFISILSAINKLENSAGIGKMSLTIVGCMLCLVMVAGFIGLLTAHVLGLDASAFVHMPSMLTTEEVNKTAAVSIPQLVTSLIPTNIFLDLTGARSVSVIGIVIFTLIAGIALLKVKKEAPEEGQKLSAGINAIQIWVMKMVRIVIALTPYGVMALMTTVFSSYRLEQFASLLGFIGACYIAIFMMFIVHAILLILSGNNPARYFRMVWPVLTFAFVSRSSAASIPLAISAQEKFGVQSTIANISASFGSSMGQNGYAGIYPAIMVAMIAPTIGIDPLSLHFLAAMLPAIALGSIGVAGVGGGGTFAALIVLSTLNFPVALVGIFIAIEPIVDMARTALNVNGSMMSGVLANRILNNHTADDMPAVIDRP